MTGIAEHGARIEQPARQLGQMDLRWVRDVAGVPYLEAGPPHGTPLLFLHGIGGAARIFAPQLDHFGQRFRAIAWNMPGYAGSAPLPLVTAEAMAAALAGFILALGLDRPVLIGHGLGGVVALRLLAERPDAARALVLMPRDLLPSDSARELLALLDEGRSLRDLAPGLVGAVIGREADPAGVALAIDCLAELPESTCRDMVSMLPGPTAPPPDIPTLVVDEDAVQGTGDLPFLERPAAFNQAVGRFLDTSAGAGR